MLAYHFSSSAKHPTSKYRAVYKWMTSLRLFQLTFLFPVLQATENLPSLQEKKQPPEKKTDSNIHGKDIKIRRQGVKYSALYWCSQSLNQYTVIQPHLYTCGKLDGDFTWISLFFSVSFIHASLFLLFFSSLEAEKLPSLGQETKNQVVMA